jgi:hypothetical protein
MNPEVFTQKDYLRLREWFVAAIEREGIDHASEPLRNDSNGAYDFAYYQLMVKARDAWMASEGVTPSDEMLSRAFFDAEITRHTRKRNRQNPLAWLRRTFKSWRNPKAHKDGVAF